MIRWLQGLWYARCPWRLWLFTRYSWGWDIGPVFGYWLVWTKSPIGTKWPLVYVSNDTTPPRPEGAHGFYISRVLSQCKGNCTAAAKQDEECQ